MALREGGRESPGVKLKLNPLRYKEVTGGRFRLPIRNNAGFVATTKEEDSKNHLTCPKACIPLFLPRTPPPIHNQEREKGARARSAPLCRWEAERPAELLSWTLDMNTIKRRAPPHPLPPAGTEGR